MNITEQQVQEAIERNGLDGWSLFDTESGRGITPGGWFDCGVKSEGFYATFLQTLKQVDFHINGEYYEVEFDEVDNYDFESKDIPANVVTFIREVVQLITGTPPTLEQQVREVLATVEGAELIGIEDGVVRFKNNRTHIKYAISRESVWFWDFHEVENRDFFNTIEAYLERDNGEGWDKEIKAIAALLTPQPSEIEQLQAQVKQLEADKVSLNSIIDDRDERIGELLNKQAELTYSYINCCSVTEAKAESRIGDLISQLDKLNSQEANIRDERTAILLELMDAKIHAAAVRP